MCFIIKINVNLWIGVSNFVVSIKITQFKATNTEHYES